MDLNIEGLASSIVREFLNRKKCLLTLKQMDDEWPRDETSISNRTKLAQALHIESWVKNNKTGHPSFKTMLEVILHNVLVLNQSCLESNNRNLSEKDKYPSREEQFVRPHTVHTSTRSRALHEDQTSSNKVEQVQVVDDLTYEDLNSIEPMSREMWNRSNQKLNENDMLDLKQLDTQKSAKNLSKSEKLEEKKILQKQNAPFSYAPTSTTETLHTQSLLNFLTDNSEKGIHSPESRKFHSDQSSHVDTMSKRLEKTCEQERKNVLYQPPQQVTFDFEIAKCLHQLIFGLQKHGFRSEWTNQNFSFCDCHDRTELLRFGIVQKKGGPCGVLALVQSVVLKYLLFSCTDTFPSESSLNVSNSDRSNCLVEAITEILWRAGENRFAVLAVLSLRKQFTPLPHEYLPDGVSEYITTLNFTSLSDLRSGVKQNIKAYECGKGSCILLLYSAILSRGIDVVKSDLDEPNGKLMGSHGYCTQEMINLLCIGRATSNAFNNTVKLDGSTLLRGVHMQSDIGLLSLFEHYRSCEIGSFYKEPKYPIWLVCSESHFTVLFGLSKKLVSQYGCPKTFELYYYDGLANQDEVIRLSIDTSTKVDGGSLNGDLVPPLEHCIRTKWPRASIDWNDTDPIL